MALLPGILIALGGSIVAMFRPTAVKRLMRLLWSQKVVVVAVILCLWGLVRLYGVLFPAGSGAVSTAETAGTWPLLRGGPERRGSVPGGQDPVQGKLVWSFCDADIKTFYASPAVVGNRLYITSARYEYFKDEGAIYGIDADTGQMVWKFQAGGYRSTFSSPAVAGRYLVVGEGLHLTDDARVFCLDVEESERQRRGVKLWEYQTRSHVECSPCIADGRAYIGAGDDGMYCFALEPDGEGNAQVAWHLDGREYPDCETSPVFHEGRLYFGLGIGGQAICCVDAETGEPIWRIPTPYPVFGSPSIADGKLYVGMGHGDFVNTAEMVAGNLRTKLTKEGKSDAEIEEAVREIRPVGEVWSIDVATGKVEWKLPVGRTVLGCVAVDGDRVYFGSRDGFLYCATPQGDLVTKWDAHTPIITSPAIGEQHVYVMTESGGLVGLDKHTLSPVWDVALNTASFSSPALARGHVYVGTTGNGLLCVGEPGGQKAAPLWAGLLGGPGAGGQIDGSLLPASGIYNWGYTGESAAASNPTSAGTVSSPPAYLDGAFYVGWNTADEHGLARLAGDGNVHNMPALAWLAETPNPVYLSAAATQESVLFVDGQPGDTDRALRCIDTASGAEKWRHRVHDSATGQSAITRKWIFIADEQDSVACLNLSDGSALWRQSVGASVGMPAPVGDLVLLSASEPPRLLALDALSGIRLWETPLSSVPETGPVFAGGRVWVGTATGLVGCSLLDGSAPAVIQCGRVVAPLVHGRNVLACVAEPGEMLLIDPATAMVTARIEDVAGQLPPLLTGDALLYLTSGAIQRYDLTTQENTRWTRIRPSWPGNVLTPMIMIDSHVLFATDRKGLVCMKPRGQ